MKTIQTSYDERHYDDRRLNNFEDWNMQNDFHAGYYESRSLSYDTDGDEGDELNASPGDMFPELADSDRED